MQLDQTSQRVKEKTIVLRSLSSSQMFWFCTKSSDYVLLSALKSCTDLSVFNKKGNVAHL